MKSIRLLSLAALMLATIFAMTGCQDILGGDEADTTGDTEFYDDTYFADLTQSLEDPDGGYDTADEAPGFGDPAFEALFEDEEDVVDPIVDCAEYQHMHGQPDRQVHYLRLTWGQLSGNPEQEIPTDWGGTISVERGGIVVMRRIRFEPATDHVILPRANMRSFEIESQTTVHYDGLLLKIIDPDPDAYTEGNLLTIAMGPAQVTVPVADLDGYDEILDVDDMGNQMSLQSPEILDVANGFLHGIWVSGPDVDRGVFRGAYLNYEGHVAGFLRGHWGFNEAGERVFKGKYIARNGQFLGIIDGTWAPDEEAVSGGCGTFSGEWRDCDCETQGVLGGQYLRGFRRGGYLSGRWVEECGL